MKNFRAMADLIKNSKIKDSYWMGLFGIIGVIIIGTQIFSESSVLPKISDVNGHLDSGEISGVDTVIPKGFVLVPIELANAEALQSMIHGKAVVDLYLPGKSHGSRGHPIGKHLKLIQAPLNPEKYAVLIHETDSPDLMNYEGPFVAVVQNPEAKNEELRPRMQSRRNLQIDYQNQ